MTRASRRFLYLCLLVGFGVIAVSPYSPMRPLPPPPPLVGQVERIVIEKAARRMQLIQDGKAVRTYRIALGFTPEGHKLRQGDGKTPEGAFTIDRRNAEIREVWAVTPIGTRVDIRP